MKTKKIQFLFNTNGAMQKIYLLLRDNKQSGPHSLEELLSMNMKNTDLIWVEGRSMGWAFPSEIESLRPFLPETEKRSVPVETPLYNKSSDHSKIYVSQPPSSFTDVRKKEAEEKAEVLRNRALGQHDETLHLKKKYSKSLDEVENDYTKWMIQNRKKKKRFSGRNIALAGILLIGSAGGWLLADMAFTKSNLKAVITSTAAENMIQDQPTAISVLDNVPGIDMDQPEKKPAASFKNLPHKTLGESKKQEEPSQSVPVGTEEIKPEVMVAGARESSIQDTEATTMEEKKLSLKEKIGNWLKGGRELSKPAAEDEKSYVDISTQVDVRVIQDPSDWMMGIKGQKLMVSNRSENALHTAIVEIYYYSEEKSLLDKKQVQVSGILKGKSKTLTIPDHKMADHVEAVIANAKGE